MACFHKEWPARKLPFLFGSKVFRFTTGLTAEPWKTLLNTSARQGGIARGNQNHPFRIQNAFAASFEYIYNIAYFAVESSSCIGVGDLMRFVSAFLAWMAFLVCGGSAYAAESQTFSYDALGRLVTAKSTGTVNNNQTRSTCYDAAGNRTVRKSDASGSAASCVQISQSTPAPSALENERPSIELLTAAAGPGASPAAYPD